MAWQEKIYRHQRLFPSKGWVLEYIPSDKGLKLILHSFEFHALKKVFKLKKTGEYSSFDSLKNQLSAPSYLGILVHGKEVGTLSCDLQHEISKDFSLASLEKWIEDDFFYGNQNQFCFEATRTASDISIAFISKEILNPLLDFLDEFALNASFLHIGNGGLYNYLQGMQYPPGTFYFANQTIEWKDDQILIQEKSSKEDHEFLSLPPTIENDAAWAYCSLLGQWYHYSNIIRLFPQDITQKFSDDQLVSSVIKKIGVSSLIVLLIGLLINTLFFDYYFKQYQALEGKKTQLSFKQKQLESLEKKFQENKTLIAQLKNRGLHSQYTDQISALIPKKITLKSFTVFPLKDDGLEYQITPQKIEISGQHHSHFYYQQWIGAIKKISWVEKIETENYRLVEAHQKTRFHLIIFTRN
ncbi:MAG: hypothetical protein N4A45_10805 [Flavobacteriales bacterium]|jgi:hypothetical protein|nr:hypothetical protein [Flavobacteriales bacterium]